MFSIKNKCKYSIHELHNHYFDPDSIWILIGLCFVVKREIIEFPKKPPAPKKTSPKKLPKDKPPSEENLMQYKPPEKPLAEKHLKF